MLENLPTKYYDGKPGEYIRVCITCKLPFIGDKRDWICPDCENPVNRDGKPWVYKIGEYDWLFGCSIAAVDEAAKRHFWAENCPEEYCPARALTDREMDSLIYKDNNGHDKMTFRQRMEELIRDNSPAGHFATTEI